MTCREYRINKKLKIKKHRKMIVALLIIIVIVVVVIFMSTPQWGRLPQGESLQRIETSPNFRDGKFQNSVPRLEQPSFLPALINFLTTKVENQRPTKPIPTMKTDLKKLDRNENLMVWLGHSSLFIQIDSIRILVDPVLITASPVSFFNRPFKGTEVYSPDDIPEVDYLLITHDHFDHLDYRTIKRLRDRIGTIITGLGVGEHFRRWKFPNDKIIELDWSDQQILSEKITLHALPAEHFSGRTSPDSDQSQWLSFMIEAPSSTIFISGDTGYGQHFYEIGKQFPNIDLALIEFGSYSYGYRDIHIYPDHFPLVVRALNVKRNFATHNGKFALGTHPWHEPLEIVAKLNETDEFNFITPMIGELIYLTDFSQQFSKWWRSIM